MKKTRIAAGVVIALGVIWTGGAWLTGKQLEKHMDQLVADVNAKIAESAPESHLQLSYQDYQRGLFSSSARFVLQSASQTEDNSLLKPGQSVVFRETIDHGPFPLAQLKRFNLLPSMASVHSELENTDAVKKLFEVAQGKSVVQAETRIGYSGSSDSRIQVLPVDYNNPQTSERFAFEGGTLDISSDAQADKVDINADIKSLALSSKNQLDMPVLFTLNGLTFDAKSKLSAEGLRIGDQNVALKTFTTAVSGKEVLALEGLKGKSSFDSKDNRVAGEIAYTLDNVKLQAQNFGQAKLVIKLADFDGKAMKEFSANYNRQVQALSSDPAVAGDPALYQQRVSELLMANLPLLLKGSPSVAIAPFSLKNDKGESSFTLNTKFKEPVAGAPASEDPAQKLDSVLASLDSKLTISMPMATELMTRAALGEGHSQEDAAKLAEQQVKGLAAMGQMFRLTTQQDDNIITSLQYASGQVTMNGEKMPLDQFLSRYMLGGGAAAPSLPE